MNKPDKATWQGINMWWYLDSEEVFFLHKSYEELQYLIALLLNEAGQRPFSYLNWKVNSYDALSLSTHETVSSSETEIAIMDRLYIESITEFSAAVPLQWATHRLTSNLIPLHTPSIQTNCLEQKPHISIHVLETLDSMQVHQILKNYSIINNDYNNID